MPDARENVANADYVQDQRNQVQHFTVKPFRGQVLLNLIVDSRKPLLSADEEQHGEDQVDLQTVHVLFGRGHADQRDNGRD